MARGCEDRAQSIPSSLACPVPADIEPFAAQILPRALSCAVLLLLLVAVLSRGKRCSIAKILRQYRAVIFHEIQNLVSGWRDLPGALDPTLGDAAELDAAPLQNVGGEG